MSGLTKPLQAGDIKELEYIEYTCETLGATWALYGDYYFGIDHWFDVNLVSMVDGKLRVTCGGDGKMGNVSYIHLDFVIDFELTTCKIYR